MTDNDRLIIKHLISAKRRIYQLDDFQDALARAVLDLLHGDAASKQSLRDEIARQETLRDQLSSEIRELEASLKP